MFRKGHFELENRERFGKPVILADNQLENLIKNILGQTERCITVTLHISHKSVGNSFENTWLRKRRRCSDAS